jgi:5-formyltetrahydrofolate cyclo-ligase
MNDNEHEDREYTSPPCYAHELDPLYRETVSPDRETWSDVSRWRKAERERLRHLRAQLDALQRARELDRIVAGLDLILTGSEISILGAYWPIHHEPDLRAWMQQQANRGLIIALPIIQERNQPLAYSRWQPGCKMRRGLWGIAEPAQDDWVEPQMVLAPVLGVDSNQYRLGYGGGYFDRSLAAAKPRRRAVAIGYSCAHIASIYPQPHDIVMDDVITG